ncbi:type VI secretion system Hcp family effector [Photorhabdus asymbiotica]|uniref:Type VI secretion system Hcp family effector n=1 Tax=Photorhabdus asymbiotica TaxID=291112 RepID=A0ABX9SHV7_9GAMM|nr:type VI secretion system Hcp family effector [Photorhabdus asymbiotica]
MSDLIYLTLKGHKQGLISAGCSSIDSIGNKGQLDHIYPMDFKMHRSLAAVLQLEIYWV